MLKFNSFTILFLCCIVLGNVHAQDRNPIGTVSDDLEAEVQLKLVARTQSFKSTELKTNDRYDSAINSPKSVIFSSDGQKYYVNSLEGHTTVVFDTKTHEKLKEIKHVFDKNDASLFLKNESTVFDYLQSEKQENPNYFSGKPVEGCLSHEGKYLWITYYRRSWDKNAQFPAALAIIDTEKDKIIRVMPTGPLPKMIAASLDGKYVAVTHWGDNTVGIISTSDNDPFKFKYTKHVVVGEKVKLSFDENEVVDRDNNCGSCLRGTLFSEDSKYLLVGRMSSSLGICVINTSDFSVKGIVQGMKGNVRHLEIVGNELFLSSNKFGYVQKCNLTKMIASCTGKTKVVQYKNWKSCYVGTGARTISVTKDGKYIFVAVNDEKKIAVVRSSDMKLINTIAADPYPVGMAISKRETRLMVTSQGKGDQGGNSVCIYSLEFPAKK